MDLKKNMFLKVNELESIMPKIFSRHHIRNILRNREKNGFDKCIIKVGRKFYIDFHAACDWAGIEIVSNDSHTSTKNKKETKK